MGTCSDLFRSKKSWSQEQMNKLLLSVKGELIHTHFIGLSMVSVMGLDSRQVVLEDELSVLIYFMIDPQTISSFVLLPGINFSLILLANKWNHSREGDKNYS